jgi:hypothetical protein
MSIGNGAFYACSSLVIVTISRQTKLGSGAFPNSVSINYSD